MYYNNHEEQPNSNRINNELNNNNKPNSKSMSNPAVVNPSTN